MPLGGLPEQAGESLALVDVEEEEEDDDADDGDDDDEEVAVL